MHNPESLKEIKIIKQNDRQKVSLIEDSDGNRYLKREINEDKREIYKILQKINHPNIPKIYYVGLTDCTTVIEEYIDGISLNDVMEQDMKLNKKQLSSVVNQILSALEMLHGENIIHRDIKPDNILIDQSHHVWLIDYDIARVYRNEIRKDTESMGTFGYAPIEQYGMLPTDFKTDIYAFGVTLKTLLDHSGIKGNLLKIADKCKRLDPSQRFRNVKAVRRIMFLNSIKYLVACGVVALVCIIIVLKYVIFDVLILQEPAQKIQSNVVTNIEQLLQNDVGAEKPVQSDDKKSAPTDKAATNKSTEKSIQSTKESTVQNKKDNNAAGDSSQTFDDSGKSKENIPDKDVISQQEKSEEFEGEFDGFATGTLEAEYCKPGNTELTGVFDTDYPYEHLVFVDDMNKKGKIRFGENDTVVNADITLNSGVLTVSLDDGKGHTFKNSFKYNGVSKYEKVYTFNLRKNADIICHDFDSDGYTELLLGVNECNISVFDKYVQQVTNYSVAWCIKYDTKRGFVLCNGEMFNKYGKFMINSRYNNSLQLPWQEADDVMYYDLKGDNVVPS